MAFKMKGHTLPGIKQRMDKSSLEDGRAKSSAFQKACTPGSTDPECGNFKIKKKGTVVSRALGKAGRWIGRGVENTVDDIKRGNRKRKVRRQKKKDSKLTRKEKGMGWDNPRYLAGPGNTPIPGTKAAKNK